MADMAARWVDFGNVTLYTRDTLVVREDRRTYVIRDGVGCRHPDCRVPAWMHVTRRTF